MKQVNAAGRKFNVHCEGSFAERTRVHTYTMVDNGAEGCDLWRAVATLTEHGWKNELTRNGAWIVRSEGQVTERDLADLVRRAKEAGQ